MGVMVGEFGVHNLTPHRFVLSWMHDTLEEFKKAGWGWALWNFTGSFGICDSGRYRHRLRRLARSQARPGHAGGAPGGVKENGIVARGRPMPAEVKARPTAPVFFPMRRLAAALACIDRHAVLSQT